jgi:malonyl-CoA/methylmalonyl-CoA synthetase
MAATGAVSDNLYARFEPIFAKAAHAPALVEPGRPTVSYGELAALVCRTANALVKAGVKPGDRVMAQVEKSVANVALYLATLKVGAVYNPLNSAYTNAELEYFIADAEPTVIVVSAERAAALDAVARRCKVAALLTLEPDGSGTLTDRAKAQTNEHATVARASGDLASLLYTSGTTGRSKGAMITHGNLVSNAMALHKLWGFVPGDVLLHALPIFHVHGLFVALNTAFLNASKIHWLAKFETEPVMRLLPDSTVIMGVPTFYTRLLGAKAFGAETCRNLRLAVSGSAPLLAETHVEFKARTGHEILERYGMTETGMITSNPCHSGRRIAGTVGFALPGVDVRIASVEGKVLATNEVGVLEVRGPNVFKGYWRNPEKTREEFRPDGYFISGDLATIADDGRVTIVGRAKDLIITGGFNVYPKEIEEELNAFPGVAESAVIGVPHPDFGEGVIGVVTPQPGTKLPPEAEILKTLGSRLAKFKLPKRVYVLESLPRNAMGKVQKNELRKAYDAEFKK